MISVEQIKHLESRVHSAVERIRALAAENRTLKERLGDYELRINEFQRVIDGFKAEQAEIESGIVSALRQLDELEDNVDAPAVDAAASRPDVSDSVAQPDEPVIAPVEPPTAEPSEVARESDAAQAIETDETEDDTDEQESPELDIF